MGLQAGTQAYSFRTSLGPRQGKNVWAAFHPPRTSGTEAIVLAASWESLGFVGDFAEGIELVNQPAGEYEGRDKTPRLKNLRGIASLLSLAEYLRGAKGSLLSLLLANLAHHVVLARYRALRQDDHLCRLGSPSRRHASLPCLVPRRAADQYVTADRLRTCNSDRKISSCRSRRAGS
jgi:hypothetical protein